jgi:hypothetical protein
MSNRNLLINVLFTVSANAAVVSLLSSGTLGFVAAIVGALAGLGAAIRIGRDL